MDIQTIEHSFNRGQMNLEQIQWLIESVKGLEEQANLMAEKSAEKEIAMEEFMRIIEEQKLEIKQLKDHRRVTNYYSMANENLALAKENDMLKGLVKA